MRSQFLILKKSIFIGVATLLIGVISLPMTVSAQYKYPGKTAKKHREKRNNPAYTKCFKREVQRLISSKSQRASQYRTSSEDAAAIRIRCKKYL